MKVKGIYAENLIRCKKYTEAIPLVATLSSQSSFCYAGPAHFFEDLIEEEFYKNITKAKAAYQLCTGKEYKAIECFQKRAGAG